MKKLLLLVLMLISSSALAEDHYRLGIDGKKHKIHKQSELDAIMKDIDVRLTPKPVQPSVIRLTGRNWVQDVLTPGLWYYGYYVSVDGKYEFRYSRKEYRAALSDFRSLYNIHYKHELKTSNISPVRVIYEPAY